MPDLEAIEHERVGDQAAVAPPRPQVLEDRSGIKMLSCQEFEVGRDAAVVAWKHIQPAEPAEQAER